MQWHFPWAALLFIPWFILMLYYFLIGRRKQGTLRVGALSSVSSFSIRASLLELPVILQFIALSVLIFALMRPQRVDTYVQRSAQGIDIMIALDTSDSMLIEDMSPGSRITAAKRVVTNFVNGLVSDRVGLIVFSGESETRVPLTLDYTVLLNNLREVETSHYDPLLRPGTAIGVALAGAVARLRFSKAKSKVIIFLTDGENNTGVIDPGTALDIVKQYQIKVYTIGVGSYIKNSLAQIPRKIRDPLGREKTIYQTVKNQINEKLLKKIAKESGGLYFRATHSKALEHIFARISELEKSPIKALKEQRRLDLFPHLLQIAALIFGASLLLSLSIFWRTI